MKKLFNLALFGAIALTGAVGISSCSSSNDEVINYSDYNPEVDAVKTQFTISLPSNVAGTRQSAATVQADQNNTSFRGFDNMVLIPYAEVTTGTDVNVSGNRLISTSITLTPTGGTANTLPQSSLATDNNSYVYSDVTIPFGTKGFLFYGKAIDGTGGNFENGSLTAAPSGLSGENTGFSFSLVPTKPTSSEGAATNLLAYINAIAATTTTTGPVTSWYNTTNTGLKDLYDKFITIKAGSSTSVSAALEDLYESLKDNTDDLSKAIINNIKANGTTYTQTNAEGKRITLGSSMNNYPGEINLPDGAVGLVWTNTTEPATAAWLGSSNDGENTWNTGSTFTPLENYVYPASLYYRADSPIKVSNSKQSDNYSSKPWAGATGSVLALYTDGNAVSPSTQSVALVEQIQYAVARLKSTIGIESTTLKDRVGSDIKIGTSATDDGTLKVTGILIGGQQNVNWQFLPPTTGSTYYTIYDKAIPSESDANVINAALSGSSPSYSGGVENNTLALETPEGTSVHIAIEFENNAKDFMGVDGMIAKGTKFYLIAELKPESAANASSGLTQVFKQDYVTTGIFKVNANTTPDTGTSVYPKGLGAAYNVIPDLRTPKLELGLSVDLTWQSGLQFEISM